MDNKKKIVIAIIVFVFILFIFFLLKRNNDTAKLELNGKTEIVLYENNPFVDPGYEIVGDDNEGYYVNIDGFVNTNTMGVYNLKYLLYNKKGTLIYQAFRRVIVLEDPNSDIEMTLNGEEEEYYFVGDYYDKGAIVFQNNIDISSRIIVVDNIIPDTPGDYQVKYQIYDNDNIKEIVRNVHIIDLKINDFSDEMKMTIDFLVNCEDYAYTILPDGVKEYSKDISFPYQEVGVYTFDIYLKSGSHKEYQVEILSIDHEGPVGTCTLTFEQSITKITVNATDQSGVSKFTYNGISYNTLTATINGIVGNVSVKVYDTKNNYTDMKCKASYGTGFRTINTTENGTVKGKDGYIVCGTNISKANQELDELMQSYGYRTRDAVVAAALYLTNYKYQIPYFWGGGYSGKGLNPKWGCRQSHSIEHNCSKPLASDNSYCEWGLDCTGFTAWAFYQAGFTKDIVRVYGQDRSTWGNFDAAKHKYAFTTNQDKVNLIKPGDIVWREGHVGMVIGVDSTSLQIVSMLGPLIVQVNSKANGKTISTNQKSFTHFVLMDDYFKMYGNS